MMSGETSDISQICKLEWFQWDMVQNEAAPSPDDVLKFSHYLGPSIDVDPAVKTKISYRIDKCSTDQCIDHSIQMR